MKGRTFTYHHSLIDVAALRTLMEPVSSDLGQTVYVKPARVKLNSTNRVLKNLNDRALEICGTVKVQITLRAMPGVEFLISFFVLKNDSFLALI